LINATAAGFNSASGIWYWPELFSGKGLPVEGSFIDAGTRSSRMSGTRLQLHSVVYKSPINLAIGYQLLAVQGSNAHPPVENS
jgi:hypothetical protein